MNRNLLHKSIQENSRISFSRSGGKGGQNVNKVNTKVHIALFLSDLKGVSEEELNRLKLKLSGMINKDGELFTDCDEERFQELNREKVFEKLENRIVNGLKIPRKRIKTKPTKASRERKLKLKKIRSEIKNNRKKVTY